MAGVGMNEMTASTEVDLPRDGEHPTQTPIGQADIVDDDEQARGDRENEEDEEWTERDNSNGGDNP